MDIFIEKRTQLINANISSFLLAPEKNTHGALKNKEHIQQNIYLRKNATSLLIKYYKKSFDLSC